MMMMMARVSCYNCMHTTLTDRLVLGKVPASAGFPLDGNDGSDSDEDEEVDPFMHSLLGADNVDDDDDEDGDDDVEEEEEGDHGAAEQSSIPLHRRLMAGLQAGKIQPPGAMRCSIFLSCFVGHDPREFLAQFLHPALSRGRGPTVSF